MLPTKGYFQDIQCPYYDSTCNRPYCHFRHRKKTQETTEEVATETVKEVEVPTYKPTPKSELANIKSHIPISYVPDLAFRPDRTIRPLPKFSFEKPTYKPTPLSILSSANKRENVLDEEQETSDIEAIREVKQNIANVEYNPEISLQNDINFENLSAEFDMIDDIIQEPKSKDSKENNVVKEEKSKEEVNKEKEKSSSEKNEKGKRSSSSSKSHKSKYHKKDTKDKSKRESKDKETKEKDKKTDKSKERHSGHKSKHKTSREKSKHKDKRRSRSRSKERHKEKEKRDKEKREKDVKSINKKSQKSSESSDDNNELLDSNNFEEFPDFEFDDDDDTLSECYKIFKEYEPPKIENIDPPVAAQPEIIKEEVNPSKKRIAHGSTNSNEGGSKINYVKPKTQVNPAQMMANRFKLAKLAQADNEQKNIINEVKQTVKRPPPSLLEAARNYKLQRLSKPKPSETPNLIDSILNSSKNKPKKIAPVQNVNSIQRAKAKIEELAKQKATETLKTPAQTIKGKRIAHVPDISLSDIPDVLNADKSKLPINVRTRFLTMIADECVKLYLIKEDAYTRALNEEFSCYEKCKVLATYKNSAMLAVNRLRKELQEREKLGLGPIGDGEPSTKDSSSDFKGKKFYNHIKGYLLTEEELDIHGYPRESQIPGQATIKNRKHVPWMNLRENQRKCSRCGKIYLVDEDGFVLYEEECIYHPLKKRTLRGEQTYLCCKSNDDAGCATSNTHVSEASETELEGYQTTMEPETDEDPRSYAVYALDCEMCYTIKGLELTRVTIVDCDCKTVYESLVKPLNPIIDYNTTFSGITKEQMDRTSTSILQVQANILHLCNSKTILIGHSLESDMKALKIIHGSVIDTSVLFPHKMGLPHKRALKALASEFLKKIIQNNVSGHDSAEDAISCMELIKWKVKEELKVRGIK